MAAFANNRSQFDTPDRPLPTNSHLHNPSQTTSSRRKSDQLPEGACNFRDLSAGPKPPGCGCRRFWPGYGAGRVDQLGLSQPQEPWCACGHHACFHDRKETSKKRNESNESSLNSKESTSEGQKALAHQRITAPTQPWLDRPAASARLHVRPDRPSTSNSAFPQIPSFHLTSSELRGYTNYNGSVGLGLDFQRSMHAARLVSQSPTVADALSMTEDLPATEPLPLTRQASTEDRVSPDRAFMQHILEGRRQAPQLEVSSVLKAPPGLGFGDIIQSATEVATPSVSATPKLTDAGHLIREAADIVETLERGVVAAVPHTDSPVDPSSHRAVLVGNQAGLLREIDTAALPSTQQLQDALRDVPGALQRLVPLLSSLQTHLSRNPDISVHESIHSLIKRMETIENASFNQLPPEQVHEQFQHMDMRLLELESRTDEHGRLISAFEPDGSNRESQIRSRRMQTENRSFASNASGQSLDSATSSALIAAAIDRIDAQERFKVVEDRLDILEAMQMPSTSLPWEVEVVLLPWGKELRGVWHDSSDFAKPGITQEDEDWTQAKGSKSASRGSISLAESGWSEHAIHRWADEEEEEKRWPKACGVNGVVYHRLRSRGLVHNVTLTSSGARDIIGTITKKFGELLDTISHGRENESMDEDSQMEDQLGFSAPFIPLRKVHKSSKLRFLIESELISPALWNAEFLAAGVLMRAAGGQKRLFITSRDGYLQEEGKGWTWSKLRQMPRVHDPESQKVTGEDVPEADAREPCWKHHPAIDGTSSAQSSFHSHLSDETEHVLKKVPVDLTRYIDYEPPQNAVEEEAANPRLHHPITPTSEFPLTQTSSYYHRKGRTLSTSLSEAALPTKARIDSLPQLARPISQQAKRRIRSFEQAANPSLIAVLPTFIPSPSKSSMRSIRIKKRRRITRSKSASSAELATQSSGQADIQSLHPEADPEQVLQHLQDVIPNGGKIKPLGYFEPRSRDGFVQQSLPIELDAYSHGNGRTVGIRGPEKRGVTPSAYATPYSGTVTGIGDLDDNYMPSESGEEEDWGGVDGDPAGSRGDVDHDEDEDDMNEDDSGLEEGSVIDDDEAVDSDGLQEDEDDEMISSEDELH